MQFLNGMWGVGHSRDSYCNLWKILNQIVIEVEIFQLYFNMFYCQAVSWTGKACSPVNSRQT